MTDLRTPLEEAISEALAHTKKPPPNEASTCDWVIKPLLLEVGYKPTDLLPQGTDANGQRPDYTILPGTEFEWFLEAKAWTVTLNDDHVRQSLIYAFTNNRRWVVLSNGREWRLYDNQITGELAAKLVAQMKLEDVEDAKRFLRALSPESMTGSGIEEFAQTERLNAILASELSDPQSTVVKAVVKVLRNTHGLGGISHESVRAALSNRRAVQVQPPQPSKNDSAIQPGLPTGSSDNWHTLEDLDKSRETLTTGQKPAELQLPDGTRTAKNHWIDVAIEIVRYISNSNGLPDLPWAAGKSQLRCFLNVRPEHPGKAKKTMFKQAEGVDPAVYIDTDRSTASFVRQCCALLATCGLPTDSVKVRLH